MITSANLFAPRPLLVAGDLPNVEEYIWLVDLNQDGKQDIVLHQPFIRRDGHGAPLHPPGTDPQRVTVLMAR